MFDIVRKISSDESSDIVINKKDSLIEIGYDNFIQDTGERCGSVP